MSTIITVSNQKGGVGKTTTSAALASGIFLTGRKVLGIDLDPQGNLGFCLGAGTDHPYTILDVLNGSVPAKDALVHTEESSRSAAADWTSCRADGNVFFGMLLHP